MIRVYPEIKGELVKKWRDQRQKAKGREVDQSWIRDRGKRKRGRPKVEMERQNRGGSEREKLCRREETMARKLCQGRIKEGNKDPK